MQSIRALLVVLVLVLLAGGAVAATPTLSPKPKLAAPNKDLVPALLYALTDPEVQVHLYARDTLVNLGAESVPGLIFLLKSQDRFLRVTGAELLARMAATGDRYPEAVPALLELLKDPDREVRKSAAYAIGLIVRTRR